MGKGEKKILSSAGQSRDRGGGGEKVNAQREGKKKGSETFSSLFLELMKVLGGKGEGGQV